MAISVVMPALEMAQETGKVVSWKKQEGEQVDKGEILLEVETDKAVVEIEAPGDGILAGVTAREGDVVPVGQTIAWLLAAGRGRAAAAPSRAGADRPAHGHYTGRRARRRAVSRRTSSGERRLPASYLPKARRLAAEHGVDRPRFAELGPGRRNSRRRHPRSRAAALEPAAADR